MRIRSSSQAYILPTGASSHRPSLYLSSPLSLSSGSSWTLVHPGTFLRINLVSSTHSPIPWLPGSGFSCSLPTVEHSAGHRFQTVPSRLHNQSGRSRIRHRLHCGVFKQGVLGFPRVSDGKESTCNAGELSLIPGLGRSPGRGHGNPLQYYCLETPHGQRSLAGYSSWGSKESDTP